MWHVYPISKRKWAVRKTGSYKALRVLSAFRPALDLAKTVADPSERIVIHRSDGTVIRIIGIIEGVKPKC